MKVVVLEVFLLSNMLHNESEANVSQDSADEVSFAMTREDVREPNDADHLSDDDSCNNGNTHTELDVCHSERK